MRRQPLRFIEVEHAARITPHMARVTFGGDDLADLVGGLAARGPDQQVKLYFPRPGQVAPRLPDPDTDLSSWYAAYTAIPEAERPWMRSYTIRAHDPARCTVDVDFVLHDSDAGPATRWAKSARPGDVLAMYGPADEFARPVPVTCDIAESDWFLMAGDESALPAIGTLAEALAPGPPAVAYVEVGGPADEQPLDSPGELTVHWVHRRSSARAGTALVESVRGAQFPAGRVFAWLGGEAGAVRALRRHLVDERGVDKRAIDFTGYWRFHSSQDDPPTEQDLADAQELLATAQERAIR